MNVIKVENKGKQLHVYERFYIYKVTKNVLRMSSMQM
jgi:hypothetical protein